MFPGECQEMEISEWMIHIPKMESGNVEMEKVPFRDSHSGNGNDFRDHSRKSFPLSKWVYNQWKWEFDGRKSFSRSQKSFPSRRKSFSSSKWEWILAVKGNSHSEDGNDFPMSGFIFILEMEMTFAEMRKNHSRKAHFLELARKSHFIFIPKWV